MPFGLLKEATNDLANPELCAHLFDAIILPALCYAAEKWADTVSETTNYLQTLKRCLLKCNRQFNIGLVFGILISGKCPVFVPS